MPSRSSSPRKENSKDEYGRMTVELISRICKEKDGYRTPELNEKLYLHFRCFKKIENLEPFVNCKALWLENNLLTEINGVECLKHLDSLYMQHNSIRSLTTLDVPLLTVRTLNISYNHLENLKGIEHLPCLEKLLVSHNEIEDISAISSLSSLTILDVSHNRIQDGDTTMEIIAKSKRLASLMMHGNEFVRHIRNYRRVVIAQNGCLRYLDEYPVFDDERRCAEAFCRGGLPAEKAERETIKREEEDRRRQQRNFFDNLVSSARSRRSEAPAPTAYFVQMAEEEESDDAIYVPPKASSAATSSKSQPKPKLANKPSRHVDVNSDMIFQSDTVNATQTETTAINVIDQSENDVLSMFRLSDEVTEEIARRAS